MAGVYNATAQPKDTKQGKVNNACLPDLQALIQAGIDPKTGLPIRFANGVCNYKASIKTNNLLNGY